MVTEDPTILSLVNAGGGLLLMALSIPLILRKVPENYVYGVRYPQCFTSEKNWYDINAAGGKILFGWSLPIFLMGLYGLLVLPSAMFYYQLTLFLGLGCILAACLHSYLAARHIAAENAKEPL